MDVQILGSLGLGIIAGAVVFFLLSNDDNFKIRFSRNLGKVPRWLEVGFYSLIILFLAYCAILDLGAFETFNLYGLDFAIYDQATWNALHGRVFQNTLMPDAPVVLGNHFSPILLAFAPLYALYSDPRILVLAPVLCVALTIFPLYWYARQQLGRLLAVGITSVFLTAPGVQYLALGQFYGTMLAMPLLFLAGIFLLKRRYLPLLICLGLLFLTEEDMPLIAIGFGFFLLIIHRKYSLSIVLITLSVLWFVTLIQVIMPFLQGGSNYYFFTSNGYGSGQYAYLGDNLLAILQTMVSRPDVVWQHVAVPSKIDPVVKNLIPLGLFPFLAPEVSALALPTLSYTLLSERESQFNFGSHNYALVFPFLFLAVIMGIRRLRQRMGYDRSGSWKEFAFQVAFAVSMLVTGIWTDYSDSPFSGNFDGVRNMSADHDRLGHAIAKMIPANATVLAQMELLPVVSQREQVYELHNIPCLSLADFVFADTSRPWHSYFQSDWDRVLTSPFFDTVIDKEGYRLKKRQGETSLDISGVDFNNGARLVSYSLPVSPTVMGGQELALLLTWDTSRMVKPYSVRLELMDRQDHVWAQADHEACRYSSTTMQQMVHEDWVLQTTPLMPAGIYQVALTLYDTQTKQPIAINESSSRGSKTEQPLTFLKFVKNKSSIPASQLEIEQRLYVDIAEVRLLGYVPNRETIHPGELFQIGLYWRAREKPRGDYSVAVQFRDPKGTPIFEQASRPASNTFPTTQWDVGEVLLDWHDFNLPIDIIPNDYQVFIVLRDAASGSVIGESLVSKISVLF